MAETLVNSLLESVGRVKHRELGTGTVMTCHPADESDREHYRGDAPFKVGMKLCLVDWDDGGTTDTLVASDELTSLEDGGGSEDSGRVSLSISPEDAAWLQETMKQIVDVSDEPEDVDDKAAATRILNALRSR